MLNRKPRSKINPKALTPCVLMAYPDLEGYLYVKTVLSASLHLKKELWKYGKAKNNTIELSEDTPLADLKHLLYIRARELLRAGCAQDTEGYSLIPAVVAQYLSVTLAYLIRYRGSWEDVYSNYMFKHTMYPELAFTLTPDQDKKVYRLRLAKLKDFIFELPFKRLGEELLIGKPKKLYIFKKAPTAFYYCYFTFEPRAHRYFKKPPKHIIGLDLSPKGYIDHLSKIHRKVEERLEVVIELRDQYYYVNFVANEARRLTQEYRVICMESTYGSRLGSWRQFQTAIKAYAAITPQCHLIALRPAYTSQMCCICEMIGMENDPFSYNRFGSKRNIDINYCPYCENTMHKDGNAAVNILRKGLAKTDRMPEWLLKKRSKARVTRLTSDIPEGEANLDVPLIMPNLPEDLAWIRILEMRHHSHPYKGILGCVINGDGDFVSSSDSLKIRSLFDIEYHKGLRLKLKLIEKLVHNFSLIFVAQPMPDPFGFGWKEFFIRLEQRAMESNARFFYTHYTGTTLPCLYCNSKVVGDICRVCGHKVEREDNAKWLLREGLKVLKKDMESKKGDYKKSTAYLEEDDKDNYPFWWDLWGPA